MKPNSLIKDSDYRQALDEMGFCVIPLFTSEQMENIRSLYQKFAQANPVTGLKANHSKVKPEMSIQLSDSIKEIVLPSLESWFRDFNFFVGGFMVNEANTSEEFPLHQDWNIVDEVKYTSYQIWIPLELSHPNDGGMYLLPGSHRFYHNYRSGSYNIPKTDTDEKLASLVTDMIIAPGQGLVYHNSLFHASYPNTSNQNKISALVSIYQKNAPLIYYHKNTLENCSEIYGINEDVFLSSLNQLDIGGTPQNPLYKDSAPINETDNKKINQTELTNRFKTRFGEDWKNFEPRQLHIIKDAELERKMQRDGYAVIDFADENRVEELKMAYLKNFSARQTTTGRFTTLENTPSETRRHFHELILQKMDVAVRNYFTDYHIPIATYFTKYANSKGDLEWHNDSSLLLNAHLEPHYAIWCPLIEVTENNGTLCVVEKSHKFNRDIILYDLPWPFSSLAPLFEKQKTILHLKAGQAVIFDIRLMHDATPNNTDEDRICFSFRITHKKSRYYRFSCETEDKKRVSVFEETTDYYLRDDWGTCKRPLPNTKIGELQNLHSRIDLPKVKVALGDTATSME
jgi:ectoine hydroxylase-related dioxygenase (phytanoyl-CoA dioxygenase family)